MGFHYITGNIAASADELADWFVVFTDWLVDTVGWELAADNGAKDKVFRSDGEEGEYTLLFVRYFEWMADQMRVEVQDDAIGTHATTEGGSMWTGNNAFTWFAAANLEAIALCFREIGGQYFSNYGGCVRQFPLSIPDETYKMIAAQNVDNCSILRDADGTWNVDYAVKNNQRSEIMHRSTLDNSYPVFGLVAGDDRNLIGQLYHIYAEVDTGQLAHEDTLSQWANANDTTDFIILQDSLTNHYPMMTGGTEPTGVPLPTSYAYQTGVVSTYPTHEEFIGTVLPTFLAARGWQNLGSQGVMVYDRMFYSRGVSGSDDIYVIVAFDGDEIYLYVQDDAVGTHRTAAAVRNTWENQSRASRYHICGDADCFLMTWDNPSTNEAMWAGKMIPSVRDQDTEYSVACFSSYLDSNRQLRGHDGVWTPVNTFRIDEFQVGSPGEDSSPSAFDSQTYHLFPEGLFQNIGVGREFLGTMKYYWKGQGAYGNGDIVPVAGFNYRLFRNSLFFWAMQT